MGDFETLGLYEPELLTPSHHTAEFESGKPSLDMWLRHQALSNQSENYTRTFVTCNADWHVAGYYSLCASLLLRRDAPRALAPHGAPAELPTVLLARLAIGMGYQRKGLGIGLLKHALQSVAAASRTVAFRGVMVDALDEDAAAFYLAVGFRQTRSNPLRLVLSMSDVLRTWMAHAPPKL